MVFVANFWDVILDRFHATSMHLQKSDIDISVAAQLLSSLRDFVAGLRDQFEAFERAALNVTGVSQSYKHNLQRKRKRKTFADESSEPGVTLEGREKFKIETFYVVIDNPDHRLDAYKHLTSLFGVLFMSDQVSNSDVIVEKVNALSAAYPSDLDINFANKLKSNSSLSCLTLRVRSAQLNCLRRCRHLICSQCSRVFSWHFLTLPVTDCQGERTFSLLGRIKNQLWSSMCQTRLSSLSLMSIESDLDRQLNLGAHGTMIWP